MIKYFRVTKTKWVAINIFFNFYLKNIFQSVIIMWEREKKGHKHVNKICLKRNKTKHKCSWDKNKTAQNLKKYEKKVKWSLFSAGSILDHLFKCNILYKTQVYYHRQFDLIASALKQHDWCQTAWDESSLQVVCRLCSAPENRTKESPKKQSF